MAKRGPKPRLTERDQQVLIDLYLARCMVGTQLQRSVFGKQNSYSRERLIVLRERNLIRRRVYAETAYDPSKSFDHDGWIYELTDLGVWEAEKIAGERVITSAEPTEGDAEKIRITKSRSVGRYIQTAEVYLNNKQRVRWIPHFLMRHRLQIPDWKIGSLAAIEHEHQMALLFGVTKDLHLNSCKIIADHIKSARTFDINRHVLMCPDQDVVNTVTNYYQSRFIDGDLHVLRYTDAQEELPFLMGQGYLDKLIEEVKAEYFRHQCRVVKATGSHAAFENIIEYGPHPKSNQPRRSYLVDLSTGDIRRLYKLITYDLYQADTESRFNKELRGVFAFVRDEEQLAYVQSKLTNHKHVRLIVRKADGLRPWYGYDKDGWKRVERVRKH